jgi:hypothetical protein
VRVKPSAIVLLVLGGALCALGCNGPPSPLGRDCNQSCAAYCVSSGPDVDDICGTSLAEAMCAGSGHEYCTKTCAADADCQPAELAMRCLTTCDSQPAFVGLCWSEADWTSLVNDICH